jgi:vancomycin permeability regulator SanA
MSESIAATQRRGARERWRALPRWVRLTVRIGLIAALIVTALAAIPFGWTRVSAAGHVYAESDQDLPSAEVVLVLGAQVAPGGSRPMPFLRGRLDTAAALVTGGHAKVILVSGDGNGGSGNETTVMTNYLTSSRGIDPQRVVADPYGLDTYDSCIRAKRVYGVERALVVTQSYHLARAVALCHDAGVDADGVGARCDGCVSLNLARNSIRDYFACTKAALDAFHDREPAVASDPNPLVRDAVAGAG